MDSTDVGFTLVIRNPFINPDVDGSATYNFNVPATDKLKLICGFLHRVEAMQQEADLNWKTFANGRKLIDGIATAAQVDEDTYEFAVGAGKGDFFYKIKDKKLTDLNYQDVPLGNNTDEIIAYCNAVIWKNYPEIEFNFPTHEIPEFYGTNNEANPGFKGKFNHYDTSLQSFWKNKVEWVNDLAVINYNSMMPWAYLVGVIKKCFADFGYTVEGKFLQDEEIKKLLIPNNYALDFGIKRYYAHVSFFNEKSLATFSFYYNRTLKFNTINLNIDNCFTINIRNNDWSNYDNYIITKPGYHNIEGFVRFERINNTTPIDPYNNTIAVMVYKVDDYTSETLTQFLLTYEYNSDNRIEFSRQFLFTQADVGKKIYFPIYTLITDMYQADTDIKIYNFSESDLNKYSQSLNLKNHMPELGINEFLAAITSGFGAFFFYNHKNKNVIIKTATEIIQESKVIDFKQNIISTIKTKFEKSKKYKINFDFGSTEELLKENFLSLDTFNYRGEVNAVQECSGSLGDYFVVNNQNIISLASIENYIGAFREYSDNYYNIIVGEGEEEKEVKIGFGPLFMETSESYYGEGASSCIIPYTRIKGTSPYFNTGKNPMTNLRLMIYHGMQNNLLRQKYPFASSTNYDYFGNRIGNLALNLSSIDGLWEKYLKIYYDFLSHIKKGECERILSVKEFEDLDISLKHDLFQNWFIDTIEANFDNSEMIRSKLTLARRKS